MFKRIFCLLILTWCHSASDAQIQYAEQLIPQALKSRATAVVRDMETTVDMRAPDNVSVFIKKVITVLNTNGDERARLVLGYDKSTAIKGVKGQILNASGIPTGKFSLSQFKDESAVNDFSMFEDSRKKHFLPNVNVYPYTIIYEYEIRYKQNLIVPDWYPKPHPQVAVENSKYTFICKPEDEIRIKEFNYEGKPFVSRDEKQKTYTWTAKNLQASKYEAYSPDPDTYLTYVKIAPLNFVYYKSKGSYKNWEELGKWIYNDLLKDRGKLPESTIQQVKDLIKDCKSDTEKARKIYAFMQQKTRYISVQIGIGGFQPFTATEVDQLGYGDCKALVNYMQSLLEVAGIPSWYSVVYAGRAKKSLEHDFASMDQANHIILCIPFKKDTTWLECTSQKIPFGYLGNFTDDRTVLACTPEGGKLIQTPKLTTAMNLLSRKAELQLSKEGNITGSIHTEFRGSQYENYEGLMEQSPAEKEKSLKKEYDIDNINFNKISLSQEKEQNPLTKEALDITIKSYAPVNQKRMYLVVNAFNKTNSIQEVRNRTLPVYINRGYTDEDQISYSLPDGYTVELKPEDKEITTPFGKYTARISQDGNKLLYYRKISINEGTWKPEDYTGFYEFMSTVSSSDQAKVILTNREVK